MSIVLFFDSIVICNLVSPPLLLLALFDLIFFSFLESIPPVLTVLDSLVIPNLLSSEPVLFLLNLDSFSIVLLVLVSVEVKVVVLVVFVILVISSVIFPLAPVLLEVLDFSIFVVSLVFLLFP